MAIAGKRNFPVVMLTERGRFKLTVIFIKHKGTLKQITS